MEKLYYNLSEEEFSKGRKILLWIFVVLFFIGGVYVAIVGPVFGMHEINPALSAAPFGISLVVGIIAGMATIKRKDMFFLIDEEKIEFRFGVFKPKKNTFLWSNVKEIVMPHKERKAKIIFNDSSSFIINLTYIQRRKATLIRKYLYHTAGRLNKKIIRVIALKGKNR